MMGTWLAASPARPARSATGVPWPSAEMPDIVTGRERIGRPIGVADAQIAAICRDLGAMLATRNTADFEETGIELIDPWKL